MCFNGVMDNNTPTNRSYGTTRIVVQRRVWHTASCKGRPTNVLIRKSAIERVLCYFDGHGNPNYSYKMRDGSTLYLGSDYGAMNNLGHGRIVVNHRKDL